MSDILLYYILYRSFLMNSRAVAQDPFALVLVGAVGRVAEVEDPLHLLVRHARGLLEDDAVCKIKIYIRSYSTSPSKITNRCRCS